MFLAEPPLSQYDLHFNFAGVPVRVHPWFWILTAVMGANGLHRSPNAGVALLLWIAAVFVSILIHELGHSLAMRHYGTSSHIVLYSMGGLAIPHHGYRGGTWADIAVALAGPVAGFAFAGAIIAALIVSGAPFEYEFGFPYLFRVKRLELQPWNLELLIHDLLRVNIYWGIINLMPIFPLDGGRVARGILEHLNRRDGLRQSLILSIATGAVVAYLAFDNQQQYLALMFGYLAFTNYQMLQSFGGGGQWR